MVLVLFPCMKYLRLPRRSTKELNIGFFSYIVQILSSDKGSNHGSDSDYDSDYHSDDGGESESGNESNNGIEDMHATRSPKKKSGKTER